MIKFSKMGFGAAVSGITGILSREYAIVPVQRKNEEHRLARHRGRTENG
jgi:hypothetical protein